MKNNFVPSFLLIIVLSTGCTLSSPKSLLTSSMPKTAEAQFTQELSMARLAERQGTDDDAVKIYKLILSQDENNQIALHRMGVISAKKGMLDDAITYFEKSKAAGHDSADLFNDLGYAYYLQDELELSLAALKEAVALKPSLKSAHNNLGLVYGQQGRYEESLSEFKQAGDDAQAYSNLAYIQTQLGDFEESEKNFHKALEIDNSLKVAAEALVQVTNLTGNRTFPEMPENHSPFKNSPKELIAENKNNSNYIESGLSNTQNQLMKRATESSNQIVQASAELSNNSTGDVQLANGTASQPTAVAPVNYPNTNTQTGITVDQGLSGSVSTSGLHIPSSTYRISDSITTPNSVNLGNRFNQNPAQVLQGK